MIKLGHEEPVMSMNKIGKVVWAKNKDMFLTDVKCTDDEKVITDGDPLPVQVRDLDAIDLYPQSLRHNPNGRLLVACGDGEYVIYTGRNLTNKGYGQALNFVWASNSKVTIYATRESTSRVKVFKNFQEHKELSIEYAADCIFGGRLLAVRSAEAVDFYDFEQARFIRRIDVCPKKIFWSESGTVCALCCDTSFYLLNYNAELVQKFFDQGVDTEDGIEDAFELEHEVSEKVRNGCFVGDCFIYVNSANRLNYYVGGEVITLAHLNKNVYLLGYLQRENRVYLMNQQHDIISYKLLLSVLSYQTAIVRKDLDAAARQLRSIPVEEHNKLARFLESQELKELALDVTTDPEHRFDLAMQCKRLDLAYEILQSDTDGSEAKWKHLGDVSLSASFDLKLAENCFTRSRDLGGLLLIYSSTSNADGMAELAEMARQSGRNNIAFICYFLLNRVEDCVHLLCETGRIPEGAFLARTYRPSMIPEILALWRADLSTVSEKVAEALADPSTLDTEEFKWGLVAEAWSKRQNSNARPASDYVECKDNNLRNLIQELMEGEISNDAALAPTPAPVAQAEELIEEAAPIAEAPAAVVAPVVVDASPVVPASVESVADTNGAAETAVSAQQPERKTPVPEVYDEDLDFAGLDVDLPTATDDVEKSLEDLAAEIEGLNDDW
jgi:coatomer subunit beta'